MENNFKYIVYQTINIENNKIYIGVHRTPNPEKFDGYIGCGVNIYHPSSYKNPKTPFQYAVNKYGTSVFKRSVLYIFDVESNAYEKERELVTKDFIARSDTYNAIIGGMYRYDKSFITYNKIYQFDLDGNLIKEWETIYDVAEFLNTWKQSIYSAIRNKSQLYSSYWSFNNSINIKEYSNPNLCRKVYKYNLQGKCIAIYDSIGIAAKENNITPNHIVNNVKAGSLTNKEFYLSYELYDEYIKKPRMDVKNKILYLYDLEGNFIKEITPKGFFKEYNIHEYGKIADAIFYKKSLKGCQIRLEYYDKIEPYTPKNKKRAVVVYTVSGEFVKEFDSVTSACKEFKFDSSTVSKILRGCGKSTKGYTIKYKS